MREWNWQFSKAETINTWEKCLTSLTRREMKNSNWTESQAWWQAQAFKPFHPHMWEAEAGESDTSMVYRMSSGLAKAT